MIYIFDLDDTLFKELDYVKSGLLFCANKISKKTGKNNLKIYNSLFKIFKKKGRGCVFNFYFNNNKKEIKRYIKLYRKHYPNINLYNDAEKFLKKIKKEKKPMYLVTDGHSDSQLQKLKKLKIKKIFKKIFITPNYGKSFMKPSLKCFQKIKKLENCKWNEMIYIGDNPSKDFINLNKKGAITARIIRGEFSNMKCRKQYDAKIKFKNYSFLREKLYKNNLYLQKSMS